MSKPLQIPMWALEKGVAGPDKEDFMITVFLLEREKRLALMDRIYALRQYNAALIVMVSEDLNAEAA